MYKRNLQEIEGFFTKDSSFVKEIINPRIYNVKNYSIALAIVKNETKLHYHKTSEEIYLILKGKGIMKLDDETFEIKQGDVILIKPYKKHKVIAKEELHILCFSHPSYSDEDTVCLE